MLSPATPLILINRRPTYPNNHPPFLKDPLRRHLLNKHRAPRNYTYTTSYPYLSRGRLDRGHARAAGHAAA